MNKQEFTDKVDGLKYEDINEEDWDIISTVYAYHPMISDVNGKDEIAALYNKGGLGILIDMFGTADTLRLHEGNIQKNIVALENLEADQKKEMDRLIEQQRAAIQDIKNDNAAASSCIAEIHKKFN